MKNLTISIFVIAIVATMIIPITGAADGTRSLRGLTPLEETRKADELKSVKKDSAPIKRDYVQQPPLIPHDVRGYKITLKSNKCLNCHSWENYREFGATKISQTHFTNRDGIDLADVSPRRYFCSQCHVPQTDANAPVANSFQPVDALRRP
jgi:cytochrome c-type protein NapB